MRKSERNYRRAVRQREGGGDVAHHDQTVAALFRQPSGAEHGNASADGATSLFTGRLIRPTWAEVDEARDLYHREARRLRSWRWWFVGMFTLYLVLVGILLLRAVVSW